MAKNKVKKKPTARELADAVIEISNRCNQLHNLMMNLDNVIGLYIDWKGDKDKFSVHVEEKYKEFQEQMKKEASNNEQKTDGKSDKKDIPENTKDEGSGTEGVRKETD